jgi:hypothetical protein
VPAVACFVRNSGHGFPPDVKVGGFPDFDIVFVHYWKAALAEFEELQWPVDECSDYRNPTVANGFPDRHLHYSSAPDDCMYFPDGCPDCSDLYSRYSIDIELLPAVW